ncbi:MAG: O-antigen ligase family protein [Hydrogenibacillus sp.]|nr:O-antigen ligase family protein [Hydrogenibacillus sp.]
MGKRQTSFAAGLLGIWSVIFVIIPYFRGIFFYEDMIHVDVVLGLWAFVGLAGMVFAFGSGRFRSAGSPAGTATVWQNPVWAAGVTAALMLIIQYAVMARFGIRASYAWDQAYRMATVLISAIALTALLVVAGKRGRAIVLAGMGFSLGWTALFPFLAVVGVTAFPDAVLGGRLSSVYQYPNTYGALVGAGMLMALAALSEPPLDRRAGWWRLPSAWALVPLAVGFVFSTSRGAWILWPIAWWLVLWLLPAARQLRTVALTGLLWLAALPLLPFFPAWQAAHSWWALLGPAAVGIVYAGAVAVIDRIGLSRQARADVRGGGRAASRAAGAAEGPNAWRGTSRLGRAFTPLVVLLIAFIGGAALRTSAVQAFLPSDIARRLADISLTTRNAAERFSFYRDSLKLIREHWLWGAGGDAWRDVFLHYISYPYYSTQTHSFIFQLAVEVGLIGVALFTVLLLCALILGVRAYRYGDDDDRRVVLLSAIPALYLFAHGQIDFDFSFGYVLIVFFAWLALLSAAGLTAQKKSETPDAGRRVGRRTAGTTGIDAVWRSPKGRYAAALPVLLSLIALWLVVFAGREAYALRLQPSGQSLDEVVRKIDYKARVLAQHRETRLMKIELYRQIYEQTHDGHYLETARREAEAVRAMSADDPRVLLSLGRFYAAVGDDDAADQVYAQAVATAPLFLPAYEARFEWLALRALRAAEQGDRDARGAPSTIAEANAALLAMQARIQAERKRLESEPPALRYPEFTITPLMQAYAGIVKLLDGQVSEGREMLEPNVGGIADPVVRLDAMLLLAAMYDLLGDSGAREAKLAESEQWYTEQKAQSGGLPETELHARYATWRAWLESVRRE